MSLASKKSGQSAVVTGAGSGLGRDIALALAARGYIVFGTAFAAVIAHFFTTNILGGAW